MSEGQIIILMLCALMLGVLLGGFIVSTACSDVGYFHFAGSDFDCKLREAAK